VISAVTGRPVSVAVEAFLAGQQSIESVHEVIVRPRSDLDDHEPGRRMRHEDGQQPVVRLDIHEEGRAGGRQVGQPPGGAGADAELARIYGKMLRRASRIRPTPPPAGADS
jgi:hypothetical protein